MQRFVITSLNQTVNTTPCSIALGNFDGVHLGHQALLKATQETEYTPAVFTFSEEVKNFLTTTEERADKIKQNGIQLLFLASFSIIKQMSCEEFVSFLKEKLACRHVICGFNFHFGKGAVGDSQTLATLAERFGMACTVLPQVSEQDDAISSSRIRALLAKGKIETANILLGTPYAISGTVQKGYSIGRRLQVPTINLPIAVGAATIRYGVYVSRTKIEGVFYPSITNVGKNPTFEREIATCETYLLDTCGDFYEKNATVQLLYFLREEKRFDSFDALKEAIEKDLVSARNYHQTHKEI